jgi:hypothetical protein
VAGGLVGEVLARAEAADPVQADIGAWFSPQYCGLAGSVKRTDAGDAGVGQHPGVDGVNTADRLIATCGLVKSSIRLRSSGVVACTAGARWRISMPEATQTWRSRSGRCRAPRRRMG